MGFWSNFFRQIDDNIYNETKKDEQETQKWNNNLFTTQNYEQEFLHYLQSIGSNAFYIAETNISSTIVKEQIDRYKRKIQEYLNLGGRGEYIYNVNEIDEYIEVIKYLKTVNCLSRQEEFLGLDLWFAQDTIEREKEEKKITEIVDTDINSLSGVEFEKVCQQLVEKMGFETETTKVSGDGGIDLIAYNYQPLLSGKYIIQCKRYLGSVGEPIIRDLYGVVMSERANKGILMTTGTFTKSAVNFADGKQIELIDGIKMNKLLRSYAIESFFPGAEEIVMLTPQEVFLNNVMIEKQYERYENAIQKLSIANDERERAKFINWLISLTMGWVPDVSDLKERVVLFKEIKQQINQYINNKRTKKSKLLAYLYQMVYVQISILEGDFNSARFMFERLMEHKELRLSLMETIKDSPDEIHITDFLYDHQGIFTWLCYTWYDMTQIAILVDDFEYKIYLSDHDLFYGLPLLEIGRLEDTIAEFDSGARTVGNRDYFAERLNLIKSVEFLTFGDEIPLGKFAFMGGYDMEVYYEYTYDNGGYSDFAPDLYKISLDGNTLKIDGIGEINNIKHKINQWKNQK